MVAKGQLKGFMIYQVFPSFWDLTIRSKTTAPHYLINVKKLKRVYVEFDDWVETNNTNHKTTNIHLDNNLEKTKQINKNKKKPKKIIK